MTSTPTYSICIPNLNMEGTIEKALRSVLNQIDSRFEVIVVDDGSFDSSLDILKKLQEEYESLRVYALKRDRNRTLAQTRNISVSYARGKYLILHIDCDDYWHPYIADFVKVYHQIEKLIGPNFLLSGQQINMGEATFLRKHGPYKFGHMVEDQDLWLRMAKIEAWIPLDHVVFRERMRLTTSQKRKKKYLLTARVMRDEVRSGKKISDYWKDAIKSNHPQNYKYRILKALLTPVIFALAIRKGPLEMNYDGVEWNKLKSKALAASGTVDELFGKRGGTFDFEELSPIGKIIFSNSSKALSLADLDLEN